MVNSTQETEQDKWIFFVLNKLFISMLCILVFCLVSVWGCQIIELQLWAAMWVLGIQPGSPARATSAVNHWLALHPSISPALVYSSIRTLNLLTPYCFFFSRLSLTLWPPVWSWKMLSLLTQGLSALACSACLSLLLCTQLAPLLPVIYI